MPLPLRQLKAIFSRAGRRGTHIARRTVKRTLSKDYFNKLNASARMKHVRYSEKLRNVDSQIDQVRKLRGDLGHSRFDSDKGLSIQGIYDKRADALQMARNRIVRTRPRVIKAYQKAQFTNVHGLVNKKQLLQSKESYYPRNRVSPETKVVAGVVGVYGTLVGGAILANRKPKNRTRKVRRSK